MITSAKNETLLKPPPSCARRDNGFAFSARCIFILFALATCAGAQTVPQLRATIAGTTQYKESVVSPDGQWLGWTVNLRNADTTESRNSEIWLLNLSKAGAIPRKLTASRIAHAEHSLAFSPDSRQLAFLSDAGKSGQLQLYIQSVTGPVPARRITRLTGFLASPRWSPDGSRLAILFTENAPRAARPLEPSTKDSGLVEERIFEQRINIVDPRTGVAKAVTPADTYVYEYDWAPDSNRLAYTAAQGNGDNNWWIARLYTVTLSTGENRFVHKPALQIANPRWSPDGKQIGYIGGIMSDEGSTGGDIYAVPAAGGAAQDLTPARKSSPAWFTWQANGRILFAETIDGGTALATLNPTDRISETLWKSDESLKAGANEAVSVSSNGKTIASIRNSWSLAPEVWAGPRGEWTQRTHANDPLKPLWGKTEKYTGAATIPKSRDGFCTPSTTKKQRNTRWLFRCTADRHPRRSLPGRSATSTCPRFRVRAISFCSRTRVAVMGPERASRAATSKTSVTAICVTLCRAWMKPSGRCPSIRIASVLRAGATAVT
jgi:Tol biopolymer transport system component